VLFSYPLVEVSGSGVPGYPRAEDYDSRHFLSFCISSNPNRQLVEFVFCNVVLRVKDAKSRWSTDPATTWDHHGRSKRSARRLISRANR
jgi:hypothetical protein